MAKLPAGKALAPIPFPRPAPRAARYDADAWNRADLGDDVIAAAKNLDRGWSAVEARQADDRFNQWQLGEKQRYDEAVRGVEPGKARGFADAYAAGFFGRAKAFRESLPESLRPAFDEKLFGLERSLHQDAFAFEAGEQKRASRLSLDDAVEAIVPSAEGAAKLAGSDLKRSRGLAEAEGQVAARVDGDPTLGPDEKENEKRRARETIQASFAQALAPAEKQKLDPSQIHETVGERIRAVESSGNREKRNPDSAALGPDQFLEGPWLGLTRKYRPDLHQSRGEAEVLALRRNPELSAEMRERYAEENADVLEARGHDATPGAIYLAHLLGPLGAAAMLEADPATPADMVNPEAAAKNRALFYADGDTERPLTAGDFIAAANARMEGTALADWGRRLDVLRPELKLAIAKDAGIRAAREAADAALAERAAHDDRLEEAEAAISKGEFGLMDLDKAHDGGKGWLKDEADRERLKAAIERHAGEVAGYEEAVTKFFNPGYVFDTGSDDDRKAVDLLYRLGPSQGGAGLAEGDTRATTYLQRLVTRTGIVPEGAKEVVGAAMLEGDEHSRKRGVAIINEMILAVEANERIRPPSGAAGQAYSQLSDQVGGRAGDGNKAVGPNGEKPIIDWRKHFAPVLDTGLVDIDRNVALAEKMEILDFVDALRDGGIFDYKNHPKLKAERNERLTQDVLEDFGNFHYGYVAAASGYSLVEALFGAGGYQVFKRFSRGQPGGHVPHAVAAFELWLAELLSRAVSLVPLGGISSGVDFDTVRRIRRVPPHFLDGIARWLTGRGFTWGDNADDVFLIQQGWDAFYKDRR